MALAPDAVNRETASLSEGILNVHGLPGVILAGTDCLSSGRKRDRQAVRSFLKITYVVHGEAWHRRGFVRVFYTCRGQEWSICDTRPRERKPHCVPVASRD